MSQFNLCDVCGVVFKPNQNKYIVTINQVTQTPPIKDIKTIQEIMQTNQYPQQNMKILEICEACEKLLENVFTMRSKGKELERKQIEDLLNYENNIKEQE